MKKKKKREILYPIIVIFLFFILGKYFSRQTVTWGASIGWHLFNDDEVVFNNIRLNLPLRYWIDLKDENRLVLNVVPPYGIDFWGIVDIRKKIIAENDFMELKQRKEVNKEKVIGRKLENRKIGLIESNGIILNIVDKENRKHFNWEVWLLPSKEIMIIAVKYPEEYRYIFLDLLSNISYVNE